MNQLQVPSHVYLDSWENWRDVGEEFTVDTLQAVLELFERLDGKRHTLMVLSENGEDDAELTVGGGPDAYVVFARLGSSFHELRGGVDDGRGVVEVVVGGQMVELDESVRVSSVDARRAVVTWAMEHALDSALNWRWRSARGAT